MKHAMHFTQATQKQSAQSLARPPLTLVAARPASAAASAAASPSSASPAALAPLLKTLAQPMSFARREGEEVALYAIKKGISLGQGKMPWAVAEAGLSSGALIADKAGKITLSAPGKMRLARLEAGDGASSFAAQHQALAPQEMQGEAGAPIIIMQNEAENPLLWLYRRGGKEGTNPVTAARFAAGERLRADLEMAGSLPRLTTDWSRMAVDVSRSSEGLNATETMLAAQQRVTRALRAVGPEFSGLLIDLCGFLKSIAQIERERFWPARSAKVAIGLGLAALARHYGLEEQAQGPAFSYGVRGGLLAARSEERL